MIKQFQSFASKPKQVAILFLLIVAVIYGRSIGFGFTQDDDIVLRNNEFVQNFQLSEILFEDTFLGYFKEKKNLVSGGRYRPFSLLYFAVLNQISSSPSIFHFSALLIYALIGCLIYKVLSQIGSWFSSIKEQASLLSFLVTLIWLVHPSHVEAVANIKGHDELLSVGMLFLSIQFCLNWLKQQKLKYMASSALCLLLAILSKESAVVGLIIIPFLFFIKKQINSQSITKWGIALGGVSVVYFLLRVVALDMFSGTNQITNQAQENLMNYPFAQVNGMLEQFGTIFYSWLEYARLLFFPLSLSHDYYPFAFEYQSLFSIGSILGLIFILLTAILPHFLFQNKPERWYALFALIIWIIPFGITSNVLFPIGTFMAERFLFLPSIGFFLLLALTLNNVIKSQKLLFYIVIIAIMGFSARSFLRVPVWESNFTLFQNDVLVVPGSAKVNNAAGGSAYDAYQKLDSKGQGNTPEAQELLAKSHHYLRRAVQIYPNYSDAYLTLGNTFFFHKNDIDSTLWAYKKSQKPQAVKNSLAVGNRLIQNKEYESARNMFLSVADMNASTDENRIEAYELYVNSFIEQQQFQKAIQVADSLIPKVKNASKLWTKKGLAYGKGLNLLEQAKQCFITAIQLNPNNSEALENIGVVYAFTGNPAKAAEYFEKALALSPNNNNLKQNLQAAKQAMGQPTK